MTFCVTSNLRLSQFLQTASLSLSRGTLPGYIMLWTLSSKQTILKSLSWRIGSRQRYQSRQFRSSGVRSDTSNSGTSAKNNTHAKDTKERSPHARLYTDTVPAMIPVALLGSAVYFVSAFSPHIMVVSYRPGSPG
jgi:hypothetical protein